MSISQRKDGRFCVKYKDRLTGKWQQRSFRADQEAEARQFDAENQYDAVENSRMTVKEAVLAYLDNTKHARWTILQYKWLICGAEDKRSGKHKEGYAEFLANKYIDELNRRDLETVRNNARAKNLQVKTINRWTGFLQTVFNWCAEQELISDNPWRNFGPLNHETTKHRSGTVEDLNKVYQHLPPWMQWACRTSIALCLRPGRSELFSLEWSAFNWRAGTATVSMPKVGFPKTVFLPREYLEEAKVRYAEDMKNGFTLVCRNSKDRKVYEYSYVWRKACKAAGVKIPPYCMRHIAASQMLASGADITAVSAQLGHKSIATTGKFYAHVTASAQRSASEALEHLVQNGAEDEEKSNESNEF